MAHKLAHANSIIQKDAIASGIANAIVNAIIAWFMFRGKVNIPLTVDTISSHEKTVFSTAVMTAFLLSLIVGGIVFFSFGKKAKSQQLAPLELIDRLFFFFGVGSILFYSLFAFGTTVLVALFCQKFMGTILVTPIVAAIIIGLVAGIAAWFINVAVMKEMLRSA